MNIRWILAGLLLGSPAAAQDVTAVLVEHETANKSTKIAGLSGDGSLAYGTHSQQMVRWTPDGSLEVLLGGFTTNTIDDVNFDGTVAVGNKVPDPGCGDVGNAFRWTQADGLVQLDCYTGLQTYARGVSSTGEIVIVYRNHFSAPDYVWELGLGNTGFLEEPGGGAIGFSTHAISGDGSVAVGEGSYTDGIYATRWSTSTGAIVGSNDVNGSYSSEYINVSADGTALVGHFETVVSGPQQAFVVIDGTLTELGTPSGWDDAFVSDVSNGGTVITGWAKSGGDTAAVIWLDGEAQPLLLEDWLTDQGVDVAPLIPLREAVAVSDDGLTIAAHTKQQVGLSNITKGVIISRTCGEVTNYGTGLAGSGGFVPQLTATSPCLGQDFTLSISEGLGGAFANLTYGFGQLSSPFKGGTLLVVPTYVFVLPLGGTPGTPGAGFIDLDVVLPSTALLDGVDMHFQAIVPDPGAVAGFALSDGMTLGFALP